ncbi:MAG TPA: dephospho-CoA kinase [Vulgatibacter sp.]|nr:dephospho-CoA kinase [Vulgatibacter sp.]
MKRIGLTGGIATGKSAVADRIAAKGVPVIDADRIAREVVEPGRPALEEIAARWPEVVRGGELDRKALGAIVFADDRARQALEAILHPRIREELERRFHALEREGVPIAVYEAPLLVETGSHEGLDALIVVSAPEEVQIERVMHRDGLDEAQARARLAAQLPAEARLAKATFVVDNSGDLEALERNVDDVWREVERRFLHSRA